MNVVGLLCIDFACVLQENVWGFIFVASELAHRAGLSVGLVSVVFVICMQMAEL